MEDGKIGAVIEAIGAPENIDELPENNRAVATAALDWR
jgi:hypothetical protein